MEYKRVASQSELAENQMKIVEAGGREILLANVAGYYFAISNKCTHAGGSLANGTLDGTCVRCPRHGAMFDLRTGKAVEGAKIGFLKVKVRDEECFPVRLEGTDIFVGVEKILATDW